MDTLLSTDVTDVIVLLLGWNVDISLVNDSDTVVLPVDEPAT
ncbi:unnamed protein product, partial [Rotaria magnacalcarata]